MILGSHWITNSYKSATKFLLFYVAVLGWVRWHLCRQEGRRCTTTTRPLMPDHKLRIGPSPRTFVIRIVETPVESPGNYSAGDSLRALPDELAAFVLEHNINFRGPKPLHSGHTAGLVLGILHLVARDPKLMVHLNAAAQILQATKT